MTSESTSQVTVALLLLSLISMVAVAIFSGFLALIYFRRRRSVLLEVSPFRLQSPELELPRFRPAIFENACRWMMVKGNNVVAVQTALGLHNAVPCSWGEGLEHLQGHRLFVAPPVRGWILVIGHGLPDPSDDIDRCFHFIMKISRRLGQVQFFSFNRPLNHHAWAWVDAGQVRRAYCWAGETLWNQGERTGAERDLDLHCIDYCDTPELTGASSPESVGHGSEKIFALAARWSFDPASVNETAVHLHRGVAGDLIQSKPH